MIEKGHEQEHQQTREAADDRGALTQRRALAVLYVVLAALALWVVRDFAAAVAWACVLAIVLWPVLRKLEDVRALAGRRTLIAIALTLAVSVLFVLPLALTAAQAVREAHGLFVWFRDAKDNGVPMPDFLTRLPMVSRELSDWWDANLAGPLETTAMGKALHDGSIVEFSRRFGIHALHSAVQFGFMLMTLFFILRAGLGLSSQLLDGTRRAFGEHGTSLVMRMASSVRSTVTGLVTVGIGEGALLGTAYLIFDVPHAALLGMLTAIAAMLPFCAPLVFGGAALWLLSQGENAAAIGLLAFGLVIVFIAEHFVRPVLVGGSTRLPFLLALFGILGGAETFGLLGLFIGPALTTILMVLWSEWVCPEAKPAE